MVESNRVVSRLMSFILLFDCQEAFHCCLVVACSNRINMISIQCHRVGEWSAGKPECGNCIVPVWGNHDYAGLNEVAIPFKLVVLVLPKFKAGVWCPSDTRCNTGCWTEPQLVFIHGNLKDISIDVNTKPLGVNTGQSSKLVLMKQKKNPNNS